MSDLLRAALRPAGARSRSCINVWLAYPLVFLITTVSIFFRPGAAARSCRGSCDEEDLLPANSAMWVGETIADVVNYPLAGLFVVFLVSSSLPLAFWFDAVTYLASAVLLATIVVPPMVRRARPAAGEAADAERGDGERVRRPSATSRTGWAFLRARDGPAREHAPGHGRRSSRSASITVASSDPRATRSRPAPATSTAATYAFMETAIGLGNLVGGFALGAVAARVAQGPADHRRVHGVRRRRVFLLGVVHAVPIVLALLFGIGIANMAFVIPSQTLFQERTPRRADGARRQLPVRDRVRRDVDRDGRRRAADRASSGVGPVFVARRADLGRGRPRGPAGAGGARGVTRRRASRARRSVHWRPREAAPDGAPANRRPIT